MVIALALAMLVVATVGTLVLEVAVETFTLVIAFAILAVMPPVLVVSAADALRPTPRTLRWVVICVTSIGTLGASAVFALESAIWPCSVGIVGCGVGLLTAVLPHSRLHTPATGRFSSEEPEAERIRRAREFVGDRQLLLPVIVILIVAGIINPNWVLTPFVIINAIAWWIAWIVAARKIAEFEARQRSGE